MRKFLFAMILAVVSTPVFAADKDIVDTAVGAGSFKTLVAAVKAAGLVDTLKGMARLPSWPQRTKLSQNCPKVLLNLF